MAFNAMIQVRLDEKDKKDADAVFASLGLETSTAIRMFIKKAIKTQAFPFELNNDTVHFNQDGEQSRQYSLTE